MVLDKLLHHLGMSKRTRLMESDGDDDSVYSKSAPSTASSKAKLFPTSSTQHGSAKPSFWSSPLKRALSKLVEYRRLASWCRRSSKRDSSTRYAPVTSTPEVTADHKSGVDDWFCLEEEPMQLRCERQELLIQQQREQLQQQQLLICQQRQQQSILCEKQQKLLEIQQQQERQWFAHRQRHRVLQTQPRQERSQEQTRPPPLRQAQTLQRAQRANNRSKRSRSPLNSATCASPRKLRERLELLQRERRRSERLERSQHRDHEYRFDVRRGSQDPSPLIQGDLSREGCRVQQQKCIAPTKIYAKPGSEITVEMSNGRYFKVRIDVQTQHRGRRCSTPCPADVDSDREREPHENYKPQKRSPYHWTERRKPCEGFHEPCPQSTIPVNQHLTHNAISRHNKNHDRTRCQRGRKKALYGNACGTCSRTHRRPDNPGVFLSIKKRCSSAPQGILPQVIIDAPKHHTNCFSPGEQFICHYF